MNLTKDDWITLRELNNLPEWRAYRQIVEERIEDLTNKYLTDNLSVEAAWEARTQLKAIKQFQQYMDDLIEQADNQVNQLMAAELYYQAGGDSDAGFD